MILVYPRFMVGGPAAGCCHPVCQSEEGAFAFYAYSPELQPVEPCCRDQGIGDAFLGSAKIVRDVR